MTGYTKLFGSIVASTIWREPHTVRIVWITMLAMANKNGIVEASLPGLADLSRVSLDECKDALDALMSPDEYSRTTEKQGRRIEAVEGGWFVINHAKYRAKMGLDERREYFRIKQQEGRKKKKSTPSQQMSTNVKDGSAESTESTQSEAQSQTKTEPKSKEIRFAASPSIVSKKPTQQEVEAYAVELGLTKNDGAFKFDGWLSNGFTANGKPVKDWKAAMRTWQRGGFFPSQKAGSPQNRRAGEYPETIMGKIITI